MNTLVTENEKLIQHLFPIYRNKRGAIDGLGSIIKFLTGNLDAADGQRYEGIIKELQETDQQHEKIIEHQASLLLTTIEKFNDTIKDMYSNQELINTQLQEMKGSLQKEIRQSTEIINAQGLMNQIIALLQLILIKLKDLQTALVFAKTNDLHPALIGDEDLTKGLQFIEEKLLTDSQETDSKKHLFLPYPIDKTQISNYEKITNVKIYQIKEQITFILEIPLITKPKYLRYKLIPIPVFNNNNFHMILPHFNEILHSEKETIPITSDQCLEINQNEYFCKKAIPISIPNELLCETQLLSFIPTKTCDLYSFKLDDYKIIQIIDNQWVIATPYPLIISVKCALNEYKKTLSGTHVITLPSSCLVMIQKNELLVNHNINLDISNAYLPHIDTLNLNLTPTEEMHKINLKHVNLHDLQSVKNELKQVPKDIQNIHKTNHLAIGSISISLLTFLCITFIVFVLICKRKLLYKKITLKLNKSEDLEMKSIGNLQVPLAQIIENKI